MNREDLVVGKKVVWQSPHPEIQLAVEVTNVYGNYARVRVTETNNYYPIGMLLEPTFDKLSYPDNKDPLIQKVEDRYAINLGSSNHHVWLQHEATQRFRKVSHTHLMEFYQSGERKIAGVCYNNNRIVMRTEEDGLNFFDIVIGNGDPQTLNQAYRVLSEFVNFTKENEFVYGS